MRRSASEVIRNLENRIARLEKSAGMFPPKAVDLNKIPLKEAFWDMTLSDLKALNPVLSTRGLKNPNAKMSDIIFFLNMAADAWENQMGGRRASDKLEKSANPNSPLAKKLQRALPDGISVSVRRGTKGHNEVHLSWNPNNIYSEFNMSEDDYDYLGENDLSTNELRIYLEKASKIIRTNIRDSVIEQDHRRSDMDKGLIVYNLL